MALSHVPDPDLLIRTGGERRISNFLLWRQPPIPSSISAIASGPILTRSALDATIADYGRRERRFGPDRRPDRIVRLGPDRRLKGDMLKQRIITALVLLAILLPALFASTPRRSLLSLWY